MRREAYPPLRRGQAQRRAHRAVQPGVDRGRRGPDPLVQPAKNHQASGLCPRLQRPKNADARVAAIGFVPHVTRSFQRDAEERRIIGGRRVSIDRRRFAERRQCAARGLSRRLVPQVAARQPFGDGDMRVDHLRQRTRAFPWRKRQEEVAQRVRNHRLAMPVLRGGGHGDAVDGQRGVAVPQRLHLKRLHRPVMGGARLILAARN